MIGLVALLAAAGAVPAVHDLEGQRRVLVVVAPAPRSAALASQDRLLGADQAGLDERDVTLVRVIGPNVSGASDDAATLRRRLGVARDAFAVRLIGKDGHVALRESRPIAPATLFEAIDAMPMRRDEAARAARRAGAR